MPTFSELRARAESAAAAAKDKSQSYTKPSTSTKYTPARPQLAAPTPLRKPTSLSPANPSSAPPPQAIRPPPTRTTSTASNSSSARAIPAPPYEAGATQATRSSPGLPPTLPSRSSSTTTAPHSVKVQKSFSQYDENDKQAMFAVFDIFFESRSPPTPSTAPTSRQRALPPVASIPQASPDLNDSRSPFVPAPPSAPLSTRPQSTRPQSTQPRQSHLANPSLYTPSYPPPQPYSSSALTLSHCILEKPFSSPWFTDTSSPLPPPLESRTDHQSSFSWQQRNSSKQFIGMTVFGDCSVAWYRISWDVSLESNIPLLLQRIKREARYRPKPSPWDGEKLYEAHEIYGPRLSEYAQQAVTDGAPIGRGECWDLAHEGLLTIAKEVFQSLRPWNSIGRTHGHLIFWANAGDKENGKWYGGDQYAREGDVIEWRKVRISEVGAGAGSYSMLGDPDHTAIIVGTGTPSSLPSPSSSPDSPSRYSPASLTSLTVVEQSLGQAPAQRTYDLTAFSEGELWIYRPCGMRELTGVEKVQAVWPDAEDVQSWEVGDLE